MFQRSRILTLIVFAVATAACVTSQAHNLFVLVEPQADGPDLVDVIFEHFPYPGEGTYNQPHLDRGNTWVQLPDSKRKITLTLAEQTRLGKKFLQTTTDTTRPRAIVHSCKWGVYNGRLDYFHGKYLDVSSKDEAAEFARTAELPLDLVPSFDGDELRITVLFRDKPVANTRIPYGNKLPISYPRPCLAKRE